MSDNALISRYQSVKNALIPVNMRQFVSHLAGNRAPITEAEFSPADLAAIRYAIEKRGGTSGFIGYGDYSPQGFSSWMNPTQPAEGPLDILYKSYTDPAYRMETTLGSASYRMLPDGTYVVEDRYNFNAPTKKFVTNALRERGMFSLLSDAFQNTGLSGVLNLLGNVYGETEGEPGTPVSIRLPPKKKGK